MLKRMVLFLQAVTGDSSCLYAGYNYNLGEGKEIILSIPHLALIWQRLDHWEAMTIVISGLGKSSHALLSSSTGRTDLAFRVNFWFSSHILSPACRT